MKMGGGDLYSIAVETIVIAFLLRDGCVQGVKGEKGIVGEKGFTGMTGDMVGVVS